LLPHATGGKELITLSLKEVANTFETLSYQCACFFETLSTAVGLHVQPCDFDALKSAPELSPKRLRGSETSRRYQI